MLDLSSHLLDQDLLDVAVHVHELEGRIQELLDAAFAAAVGTSDALDLLVQFRSVLQVCGVGWCVGWVVVHVD